MRRKSVMGFMAGAWVLGLWLPAVCFAQAASLDDALKAVPSYEFGQSRECLTVVSDAVRDSQGNAEARKDLQNRLLAILKGKATLDAKQFACRELSLFADESAVPVLAGMLGSKETSDMARYALERIPGEAADKALLNALAGAKGMVKIGIVNSLGVRRCEAAVKALAPLATDKDKAVAEAALAALGRIGGEKAVNALDGVKKGLAPELGCAWADAYLLCADKMRAAGDNAGAAKRYEAIFNSEKAANLRVAAFNGRVAALGDAGLPLVVEALTGADTFLRAAALPFVRNFKGSAATEAFAGAMGKLDGVGQALLLAALADRGDPAALGAVNAAAKSGDHGVRVAALAATGKLGGAASVPDLAKAATSADKAEKDAARGSLDQLRGTDVDDAIVAEIKKGDAAVRTELIRSLGARNAMATVPVLLETAKDADEGVRAESFKTLGVLAGEKDVPALVELLISVQGDNARREAEKAVVAASKTIADETRQSDGVLAALPKAKSQTAKASFYTVLGQIGANSGLDAVSKAANKKDEAGEAALRALAGWPKAEALDPVMALVKKNAKDEVRRVVAMRGALRLLELPGKPAEAKLDAYAQLMKLAAKPDEKKMVLGGLGGMSGPGALALVEPCLAVEELQKEAALAAEKIKINGYKATASANAGEAPKAFDGKPDTRWHSGAAQKPDMSYTLDLGAEYEVSKITLDCSASAGDYPRGYKVFVSNDKSNWGDVVAEGKGAGPVTEIAFTPKTGQHIHIVQTGSDEKNVWSINELKVETKSVAKKK
ncbi:MAG TPA: HEAT repeat domain-containing protein [Candidatus Hydrogenedentes bacterium]|nr:HEAT repeat domain-containing protein [Candidatus Hydrogenedentota bacterium]HRT20831.1 HEAT repeat domain-containing protein [Candidatus Hydrogenedentota bacterium]HRT66088.1 HEAT repeat domain-containing protein [Candidatus Hydrogenedentota bacterium]